MPNTSQSAEFLPLLAAIPEKRHVRVICAIDGLIALMDGGFCNKTTLKSYRESILSAVETDIIRPHWDKHMAMVRSNFNLEDLYYCNVSSGPMLTAWIKRAGIVIDGSGHAPDSAYGLMVDSLRGIRDMVLPLVPLLSKEVADKAGSGIDPLVRAAATAERLAKAAARGTIYKTCPCCYHEQAVGSDGKMVHHGYNRPGYGSQTASCMGIRFQPLEVSKEGVEAVLAYATKSRDNRKAVLSERNKWVELSRTFTEPNPAGRHLKRVTKTAIVKRGEEHWDDLYSANVHRLQTEIKQLTHEITERTAVVAAWRPGFTAADAFKAARVAAGVPA